MTKNQVKKGRKKRTQGKIEIELALLIDNIDVVVGMKNVQEFGKVVEECRRDVTESCRSRRGRAKDAGKVSEYLHERVARRRIDVEVLGVGVQYKIDELVMEFVLKEQMCVVHLRRLVFFQKLVDGVKEKLPQVTRRWRRVHVLQFHRHCN